MENSDTLIGLVSRYSPSGQEAEAVRWLVERMQALGYSRAFVDEAGNAVGVIGEGERQIVLLGHIDTVPGEIPVRVEGGTLHGRGAVDAKGALACFTDAAAECGVVEGWQIVVIGAVEEERDSKGARYAAGRYAPEAAVIGEPNRWDRLALGYKGVMWADLTIRQEQSHMAGGEATSAERAFEYWGAILAEVQQANEGKTRMFDQVQASLQCMESGQDDFRQWARLGVQTRLPVGISPEDWLAALQRCAPRAEVQESGTPLAAYACEKNTRLVRAFLGAIRAEGGEPAFVYKSGTADLNVVGPVWQCPALVYGPGDSALDHTPGERIKLEEYARAVRVLREALLKLMKNQ